MKNCEMTILEQLGLISSCGQVNWNITESKQLVITRSDIKLQPSGCSIIAIISCIIKYGST